MEHVQHRGGWVGEILRLQRVRKLSEDKCEMPLLLSLKSLEVHGKGLNYTQREDIMESAMESVCLTTEPWV